MAVCMLWQLVPPRADNPRVLPAARTRHSVSPEKAAPVGRSRFAGCASHRWSRDGHIGMPASYKAASACHGATSVGGAGAATETINIPIVVRRQTCENRCRTGQGFQ